MTKFNKDERVKHPVFGLGTVLEGENEGHLTVRFDIKGETRLALKFAKLERVEDGQERSEEREWLATFYQEDEESTHFMGSHWDPFFERGWDEVLHRLPQFIPTAKPVSTYANFLPAPRRPPSSWSKGFYLAWPDQQAGLEMVLEPGPEASSVVSLFPFTRRGSQHSVVIKRVVVWSGGLEAQVEASVGGAMITFFDIHFVDNRFWYEANKTYQFILTGIAYSCRPASCKPFILDPPPQWVKDIRIERKFEPWADQEPDEPMEIAINGMAALLPIEEWDKDDYVFHGSVKKIEEVEILGQASWLLRTTVLRNLDDESDIDLEILVTRGCWEGKRSPQLGEDIEGRLWLQGYLWQPGGQEVEKW